MDTFVALLGAVGVVAAIAANSTAILRYLRGSRGAHGGGDGLAGATPLAASGLATPPSTGDLTDPSPPSAGEPQDRRARR